VSEILVWAVFLTGLGQLSVLVASAIVPFQLEWKATLAPLPKLVRQLFWVYGGYIVLSITALGLICTINAREIAEGSWLAKSFCIYVAVFWGIRLGLQLVFDVKPYLTKPYLRAGYHLLTVLFLWFVAVMIWCVIAS
jgi:hypothetical protein